MTVKQLRIELDSLPPVMDDAEILAEIYTEADGHYMQALAGGLKAINCSQIMIEVD